MDSAISSASATVQQSSIRVGFRVPQKHIICHIGDDFMGQMTQPTVSSTEGQHLVTPPGKGPIPPGQALCTVK